MTSIVYLLLSILIMAVFAALFVLRKDFVKGFKQGWDRSGIEKLKGMLRNCVILN